MTLNERVAAACGFLSVADYSGDIRLAMAAYEVMREKGWQVSMGSEDDGWVVGMRRLIGEHVVKDAPTLSEAICKAIVAAAERKAG